MYGLIPSPNWPIRLTRRDGRGVEREICWRCRKILLKDIEEKDGRFRCFWRCLNGWCPESAKPETETLRWHLALANAIREYCEWVEREEQLVIDIGDWFVQQSVVDGS